MRNALYSGLRLTADGFWRLTRAIDRRIEQNSFQPRWAPAPLLKQKDRTFPKFGFPRETDSLCPKCVTEVRTKILSGNADWKGVNEWLMTVFLNNVAGPDNVRKALAELLEAARAEVG